MADTTLPASDSETEDGICLVCHGSGWLRTDKQVGEPGFGELVECQCAKDAWWSKQWAEDSWWHGFADASLGDLPPALRDAVRAALADGKGLYLWGPVGSGKTHLAMAVIRELWPQRRPVAVPVIDLLDRIRSGYDKDAHMMASDVLAGFAGAQLLVMDDLGVEKVSDWVQAELGRLIDRRWALRDSLLTIVTSNWSPQQLQRVYPDSGTRMASRIIGMCSVIELRYPDRRLARARAGRNE